jgi:hypothetical protein
MSYRTGRTLGKALPVTCYLAEQLVWLAEQLEPQQALPVPEVQHTGDRETAAAALRVWVAPANTKRSPARTLSLRPMFIVSYLSLKQIAEEVIPP